jgi:dGTPase
MQEQLEEVRIFARHLAMARQQYPKISGRRLVHETVRRMINTLAGDLIRQSAVNIEQASPGTLDEIRIFPPLIGFSREIAQEQQELKKFLREHLYRHYKVSRMSAKARHIIRQLFGAFSSDIRLLPPEFQSRSQQDKHQAIADYIAGMTDRYALIEHAKHFKETPELR